MIYVTQPRFNFALQAGFSNRHRGSDPIVSFVGVDPKHPFRHTHARLSRLPTRALSGQTLRNPYKKRVPPKERARATKAKMKQRRRSEASHV